MAEGQTQGGVDHHPANIKQIQGVRCLRCSTISYPPRPVCTKCGSDQFERVELSGRGRLLTYSVIYFGTSIMTAAGYNRSHPYCSGIVQLDEGPRVSAQILGLDFDHPGDVALNTPVEAIWIERGEGNQHRELLAFTL